MVDVKIIVAVRNKYRALGPVMDEAVGWRGAGLHAKRWPLGGVASRRYPRRWGFHVPLFEPASPKYKVAHSRRKRSLKRTRSATPVVVGTVVSERDPTLPGDLNALLESSAPGDPRSPLCWTSKSTRHLAEALAQRCRSVSHHTVARLLSELNYSLQGNRKTREGSFHPDRDAQFEHINKQVQAFQKRGQPVVPVDTKKKELIGDFKNAGREWHPKRTPEYVRIKDFPDKRLGKGIPYGVYDLSTNTGWVSVGIDHDRPGLPPKRCAVGGSIWAREFIPKPKSYS